MSAIANDAGTAYVEVRPELKGFGRELAHGVDNEVDKTSRNVESKLGGAFSRVAVAAGSIFAVKMGVDAFKGLIDGASNLAETVSKSNAIFGENAKVVDTWASGAAKSFGQSKQSALDAAASFGNMFQQLGIGGEQAVKMSTGMTELASDFASFHNADITEVIAAQTAAFRGEYDAVQRFVPTINAAAVEQKALEMGLAGSTKELTQQHKALATEALLMEGAGKAMGDFDRTSDGLANKQRILSAQFQDTKDKLGTALLPVVLSAMEGFLKFGEALSGPVQSAFASVVSFVRDHWPTIQKVVGGVADFLTGTVGPAIQQFAGFIAAKFSELVGWVKEHWGAIQEAITHVVNAIKVIWQTWGDEILNIARIVWDQIRTVVETAINLVKGIIETVVALINGEWGAAWDAIKGILSTAWDFIKETVTNAIGIVGQLIEAGMSLVRTGWDAAWNGVKDFLSGIWDGLKDIVATGIREVVDFFLAGIEAVLGGAERMFGWVPGVGGKLREAAAAFEQFRDEVNAALGGIQDKTVNVTIQTSGGVPEGTYVGAMAAGGQVPRYFAVGGGPRGTDTVPAWLTPGEFVVNADAVQAVGLSTLRAINAMHDGGVVPGARGSEMLAQASQVVIDYDRLAAALRKANEGMAVNLDGRLVGQVMENGRRVYS